MPSQDDIARARAWLGVFFDDLPEKIRPHALPHDGARHTCMRALDALERERHRGERSRRKKTPMDTQLVLSGMEPEDKQS